jgi:hypothetical protein
MSYRAESIKAAPKDTLCAWTNGKGRYSTCKGDHGKPSPAIHILLKSLPVGSAGTALCGYHSPFDVLPEERDQYGVGMQVASHATDEYGRIKYTGYVCVMTPQGWAHDITCPTHADHYYRDGVWS